MTDTTDLATLEARFRADGIKRAAFCDLLGISQPKLRRQLEAGPDAEVPRTLALAMSAVASGLKPYDASGGALQASPMGIRKAKGGRRASKGAETPAAI